MPTFASRPLNPSKGGLNGFLRQHPLAFGVPFVIIIIGASFGLKGFTDLGVEKKDAKVTVVSATTGQVLKLTEFMVRSRKMKRSSAN